MSKGNDHIQVRQAAIHDVQAVAELFNQYRLFYGQQSDLAGAQRFVSERLTYMQSSIFLAWDVEKDEAVAFMQLYPTFSSVSMQHSWILNDLFVAESYRRYGIARQLLEAARNYAKLTNAKGLELCTASDNVKAQALYESFGFERDEQFFHYFYSIQQ